MDSSDPPVSKPDIQENITAASLMQSQSGDEPEGVKEAENELDTVSDHHDVPDQHKTTRTRTLTEKGLEYQRTLKDAQYQKTLRKLRDKVHALDMKWTDISDPHALREERADVEECRQALEKAQSEYLPLLSDEEAHDLIDGSTRVTRQAVELRGKVGDMIFELEKVESRSRHSSRSSSSKKTGHSHASRSSNRTQISVLKIKTMAALARKEVEMKYARIEPEKKLEMLKKKYEIEEIQRIRSYERAKAEADVVTKIEEEEKGLTFADLSQYQTNEDNKEDRIREYVASLPAVSPVGSQIPLPDPVLLPNGVHHPASSRQIVDATSTDVPKLHLPLREPNNCQGNLPGQQDHSTNPFQERYHMPTIPYYHPAMPAQQQGIAEAIAEGMEAARLPTTRLTVFNGNPLDWHTFEDVIEKRTTNPNERILYLLQYLSGTPKKIVEGYQFVQTVGAYTEAKKTLERRFGHPSVVAEAFRNKLENWQKIPPRDGNVLREFADFLKTCELAMH